MKHTTAAGLLARRAVEESGAEGHGLTRGEVVMIWPSILSMVRRPVGLPSLMVAQGGGSWRWLMAVAALAFVVRVDSRLSPHGVLRTTTHGLARATQRDKLATQKDRAP